MAVRVRHLSRIRNGIDVHLISMMRYARCLSCIQSIARSSGHTRKPNVPIRLQSSFLVLLLLLQLLLVRFIRRRLGHNIRQELKVVVSRDRIRDVSVRDCAARLALGFGDVLALLDEVEEELLGSDRDGEGCVVRAVLDVFVGVDDLLDACH